MDETYYNQARSNPGFSSFWQTKHYNLERMQVELNKSLTCKRYRHELRAFIAHDATTQSAVMPASEQPKRTQTVQASWNFSVRYPFHNCFFKCWNKKKEIKQITNLYSYTGMNKLMNIEHTLSASHVYPNGTGNHVSPQVLELVLWVNYIDDTPTWRHLTQSGIISG